MLVALVSMIFSLLSTVSSQSFTFEENLNEGSPCYAALEVRPIVSYLTLKTTFYLRQKIFIMSLHSFRAISFVQGVTKRCRLS